MESLVGKFVEQLRVDQMNLAQVPLARIGADTRAVLHRHAGVRVVLASSVSTAIPRGRKLRRRLRLLARLSLRTYVVCLSACLHRDFTDHTPADPRTVGRCLLRDLSLWVASGAGDEPCPRPYSTWWAVFALSLPTSLLLGWLSWHLLEKRALGLKRISYFQRQPVSPLS